MMNHPVLTTAAVATVLIAGCRGQLPEPATQTAPSAAPATAAEHGHNAGDHGGRIVPIGLDNFHAEAVVSRDGILRIYLLGKDESRVVEVGQQTLAAFARPEGATEAMELKLEPAPQSGDAEGKTSLFRGTLPAELRGKTLAVTVPAIRIHGERFRFGFTLAAPAHTESDMPQHTGLPTWTPADEKEEQDLYLTPGGRYTAEDIQRNGSMTASRKFRGVRPAHDAHPKPGDAICPVSRTKANPKFVWYIGGKGYTFCCVPCIDEFVRDAKENPERILDPSDYIQS